MVLERQEERLRWGRVGERLEQESGLEKAEQAGSGRKEDGEKIGHPAAGENVERGPEGRRKPSTQSGDLVLSPPHRLPRPRTS